MEETKHAETSAIRLQLERTQYHEHTAPVFLTSSFIFDTAEEMRDAFSDQNDSFIYSRYSNPNTQEFIKKIAMLEGAEDGVAYASGMAAIYTTFMALLSSGDHVISCSSVFGATHALFTKHFARINITHSYFDVNHPETIEQLIHSKTRFIYLETPTNPAINLVDLSYVAEIAKRNGVLLIVDNCFATPFLQQPILYGADLVIHSATKYIDGQGRVLGGIVVGREELIHEIYLFGRLTGPSLSPFNAWMLSKSLETLGIRMERHSENALYVAKALQRHPRIQSVSYPFLPSHPNYELAVKQMKFGGGILTITLRDEVEAGRFLNKLCMIKISPNLGDTRSIATHPASSTHCKLTEEERLAVGITPGLIRLSIGLENKEDILNDIINALEL